MGRASFPKLKRTGVWGCAWVTHEWKNSCTKKPLWIQTSTKAKVVICPPSHFSLVPFFSGILAKFNDTPQNWKNNDEWWWWCLEAFCKLFLGLMTQLLRIWSNTEVRKQSDDVLFIYSNSSLKFDSLFLYSLSKYQGQSRGIKVQMG